MAERVTRLSGHLNGAWCTISLPGAGGWLVITQSDTRPKRARSDYPDTYFHVFAGMEREPGVVAVHPACLSVREWSSELFTACNARCRGT